VFAPIGSPQHEFSWHDVEEKFFDCADAGSMEPDDARRVFAALSDLSAVKDVRELLFSFTLPRPD